MYNQCMKNKLAKKYLPKDIEKKWQEKWEEESLYKFQYSGDRETYYNLVELPYPSGDLHLGHWFAFVPPDVHARFMRMDGKNVFYPNGFDAFGLPAENAAIKRDIHPRDWTLSNIETMKRQFSTMGTMIDWSHEVVTCEPEYYRWNQWIFLQFFKKGLAYRGKTLSNWCPSCQTVLANEAIESGKCWRCGTTVVQKEIEQWFLRITDYADKLLWDNTDEKTSNGVNWPRSVREGQNNWIGRSEGAVISFPLDKKFKFIILHGFGGDPEGNFYPWLKKSLEDQGHEVALPQLPNTDNPTEEEQVAFVLDNFELDLNTVLYGHSLGSIVALKVAERLNKPIAGLVLSGTFGQPKFLDFERPFKDTFNFEFKPEKIKSNAGFIRVIHDVNDPAIPEGEAQDIADMLGVGLEKVEARGAHFHAKEEPEILKRIMPSVVVFTTRPDTLYGATFMVVSPEHPILNGVENPEVRDYVLRSVQKTELERKEQKEKTGVFSGEYVLHPLTSEKLPIWVADYVLWGYGTGAIMAVPGHDERDFEFAKKHDLPIKQVVKAPVEAEGQVYSGYGQIINSDSWDSLKTPQDMGKIIDSLKDSGIGEKKTTYHLHDWSVSRQRYWGTPVPMIHCSDCGIMPVPEKDLPVELPYEVDYTPKGKPPLATASEWMKVKCPECGKDAKRDAETLDTFFDSAWYYYRYIDPKYEKGPVNKDLTSKIMPIDVYSGGSEHTLGHTLYARFFTKFFKDLGLVELSEFAHRRIQHGIILGPDGNRMSKSKGNVVNPDDLVREYGADTVRIYLCFIMPYEDTVAPWNPKAIAGVNRFLMRIWQMTEKVEDSEPSRQDLHQMHKTIKNVGDDLKEFKFNTAVAFLMEWINYLSGKKAVCSVEYRNLILMLSPFAPHMAEEIWANLVGIKESVHLQPWPKYKSEYLVEDEVVIAVQVGGKLRGQIKAGKDSAQEELEKLAREDENVMKHLAEKKIVKVIYVQGKILNFVVK